MSSFQSFSCNGLSVIEWSDGQRAIGFTYGPKPHCKVYLEIEVESSNSTALFQIRTHLSLKPRKYKTPLNLVILPELVKSIKYTPTMEISQEVLDKLKVRHGRDMSSDVIGLHFSLAQPPIMLAPKSTTFEAKTTNYEDVLAELQSLAQARSFTAYISGTDLPLDRAYDVSWMIEEEAVKSPKGALRIDDMYKGVSSEVVTWEQLCSRPPMYGAVGPDIPPSADADASRTVAESSKKRRLDESAAKPFDMEELANKVQDLQLSHDNFRQEHDDTVKTVREERDRIDKKVNELRDTHDEQIYELELDFDQLRTETDRKLEGDYHWIHGEMKGLADQAARLQIVVDGLQRTVDAVHGALNSERAE